MVNVNMDSQHDIISQSIFEFVRQYIDQKDKILEVGAGTGELVQKFLTYNYNISGIEKSSQKVAIARGNGIELTHTDIKSLHYDQPFDVILMIRVLHHNDYQSLLNQADSLLKNNGLLIIEEFGRERVSSLSLSWLFGLLSILQSAGLAEFEGSYPGLQSPQEIWDEHFHNPKLPPAKDVMDAVTNNFKIIENTSTPYLYRYVANRLKEGSRNNRIIQKIRDIEQEYIDQNQFEGVGVRIVAKRLNK